MTTIDLLIRDEHQAARLLSEVNGAALDEAVFERASAYEDPLLASIKREVVVPLGRLEAMEDRLMARIEAFARDAGGDSLDEKVNAVVASEKIMPQGTAELIEQRVLEKIELRRTKKQQARYAWPVFNLVESMFSMTASRIALVAGIGCFMLMALFLARNWILDAPLVTLITQAYGTAYRDDLAVSVSSGTTLDCRSDGSMTIVNNAGTVALIDEITITVDKASRRHVKYRVASPGAPAHMPAGGRAEFLVVKRSRGQRFLVETPWYDIHVVGTRFSVTREQQGGISTSLVEGSVRISSRFFNDTVLTAGQVLYYDPTMMTCRIMPGHAAAGERRGHYLGAEPERARCRLLVLSTPPRASVFINDDPAGITPFATVLPEGRYGISLRCHGRASVDTVVMLRDPQLSLTMALGPLEEPLVSVTKTATRFRKKAASNTDKQDLARKARTLLYDAQQCENSDWKKAFKLYKQLAADDDIPAIYRETALFSFSRLTADKARDTAAAIRDFTAYRLQYPKGMFVGEALLRLSELELSRNPSNAVGYFRAFLATSPDHPRRAEVAYRMGILLQQHREYAQAIRMFTIALDETKATRLGRRADIKRMIAAAESLLERRSSTSAASQGK
ncbi:MAG: FecR domain-containing protein [Chitinispirillaceae bacterium]|nr:FecR domain-containing protein [Chitinispirillaceae bacterium]